jgi:hypothetical protein
MDRLWLANIAPDTSDDEIKALVAKYAPDLECIEITHAEGQGNRPGVMMTFTGKKFDSLGKLEHRLNGMYWKGRALACSKAIF